MTEQEIRALVAGSRAALDFEKMSMLAPEPQRTLSIVSVCQFCLESATPPQADRTGGWFTSKLSHPPYNNPFGIKFSQRLKDYGSFDEWSWEIENGVRVDQVETFQRFPDLAIAVSEHQRLLLMKEPIRNALIQGWVGICVALGPPVDATHCGYSTDPDYAKVLTSIGSESGLERPGWLEWYAQGADPAKKPTS